MRGLVLAMMLAPFAFPQEARAWGDDGHTVVCEIAFRELTPEARAEVVRLIGKDPKFQRFNESCTWPDDQPRLRPPDHFLNLPRDATELGDDPCPVSDTCVVTAIGEDVAILKSDASDARKLAALKALGHWVGDVHQPLHVSFKDDLGGNRISQTGPCRYSLHSAWDTCLVVETLGRDPVAAGVRVHSEITTEDRAAWLSDRTPAGWANESFAIARSPSVGYCVQEGTRCIYERGNPTYERGETVKSVRVDAAYIALHAPTVRLRIKQAGVRLGALLNDAFAN